MARQKNRGEYIEDEPGLDISSLIDVCFLLLIYFIVATTIQAIEQDVNMNLPGTGEPGVTEVQPMFIKIVEGGVIYVGAGDSAVQMDTDPDDRSVALLDARLATYKSGCDLANTEPVIQIKVSSEVKQQRVLDVLNALKKNEIKAATFTDFTE